VSQVAHADLLLLRSRQRRWHWRTPQRLSERDGGGSSPATTGGARASTAPIATAISTVPVAAAPPLPASVMVAPAATAVVCRVLCTAAFVSQLEAALLPHQLAIGITISQKRVLSLWNQPPPASVAMATTPVSAAAPTTAAVDTVASALANVVRLRCAFRATIAVPTTPPPRRSANAATGAVAAMAVAEASGVCELLTRTRGQAWIPCRLVADYATGTNASTASAMGQTACTAARCTPSAAAAAAAPGTALRAAAAEAWQATGRHQAHAGHHGAERSHHGRAQDPPHAHRHGHAHCLHAHLHAKLHSHAQETGGMGAFLRPMVAPA